MQDDQLARIKQFYDDEYYGSLLRDHPLSWHYAKIADRLGPTTWTARYHQTWAMAPRTAW